MKNWNPEKYSECRVCKVQRKASQLDKSSTCIDRDLCATLSENVRRLPFVGVDAAKPGADQTVVTITEIVTLHPEKP